MIDRPPSAPEKTVLVHIEFPSSSHSNALSEFRELAVSAGAEIVDVLTAVRQKPDPKFYVGSGKVEEVRAAILVNQADLVIFNHPLSPAQERNLERALQCRVIDRYGLILDIFAQRARTFEGKLQVELALLAHLSTRLIRGWTHLERQKGGIGLRGPGETQLETDRRLIRERIKHIQKKLQSVKQQRAQSRRMRHRAAIPTVALVGYTNAGKSTLFNQLTTADVLVENRLFATLDPTLRRLELPHCGAVVIADTVGFISDLPHELVEAFSATLEETKDADLLLHVIDASNIENDAQMQAVASVLSMIGADSIPTLKVFNKIDCTDNPKPRLIRDRKRHITKIYLSAHTGGGIKLLKQAIAEYLYGEPIRRQICLGPNEGQLRAQLYQLQAVESESIDEAGNWLLSICLSKHDFERLYPLHFKT